MSCLASVTSFASIPQTFVPLHAFEKPLRYSNPVISSPSYRLPVLIGVQTDLMNRQENLTWLLVQLLSRRFLACARCKLWWMTPEWGSRALDIPPETQFLLLEVEEGGPYAIALPLIDNQTFRGTLRGPRRWDFYLSCMSHDL